MSEETQSNVEVKGKNLICYIKVKETLYKSTELRNLINSEKMEGVVFSNDMKGYLSINENENIIICYPIFEKSIKIIDSKGKQFKSTICFAEDVKNIIDYLKMKNPNYYDGKIGQYIQLTPKNYFKFLLSTKDTIKDITFSEINFKNLEKEYNAKENNIEKKMKISLIKEINDNLDNYLKFSFVKDEKFFFTRERLYFGEDIQDFYTEEGKKIKGICGNYSSGKSISILFFNYSFTFPTLYLNLKSLKNSFLTNGYTTILPNEAMNIFIKNKKEYKDYKKFIETIYHKEYIFFDDFIIAIISFFREWNALIFLDQYSQELFHKEFIGELKNQLDFKESKLKILLINSMNDKWIRDIYINSILNFFKKASNNGEIDFIFLSKLINKENLPSEQIKDEIIPYLEIFDYLPLYYSYIIKNQNKIDTYISNTKVDIGNKIEKFFTKNGHKDILIQMNDIRMKIDEEIDKNFFEEYSHLIPFKYFYIYTQYINDAPIAFLRCHFPLIKEVWNDIIYNKTTKLFDGEINYTGNVIGTFLELNFINQCKRGKLKLDIDCVVELDTLFQMNSIENKNTDDFENKNILIIQKNENGPKFDVGFLRAKNVQNPSMSYIQIKKGSTDNKVDKIDTNNTFERNKYKFYKLFKIKPTSCYLIYITLINKLIEKNIKLFSELKQKKDLKIELDDKTVNIIKSINSLDNFCLERNIILYYFNPSESKFYTRKDNIFTESNLNLFENVSKTSESIKIKARFLSKKKERQLEENEYKAMLYNNNIFADNSKNFDISTDNKDLDFSDVFKFIKENCDEGKINTFIMLKKEEENMLKYNRNDKIIILCLCIDEEKKYKIKSVIYKDFIFQYNNNKNNKFIDSFEIDVKDYDLLVWIQFSKFKIRGKIYEYQEIYK